MNIAFGVYGPDRLRFSYGLVNALSDIVLRVEHFAVSKKLTCPRRNNPYLARKLF